jgi:hypothetical protein
MSRRRQRRKRRRRQKVRHLLDQLAEITAAFITERALSTRLAEALARERRQCGCRTN